MPALSELLIDLLRHIGNGDAVTLVPVTQMLTTQRPKIRYSRLVRSQVLDYCYWSDGQERNRLGCRARHRNVL
jgi:hypothetical protein